MNFFLIILLLVSFVFSQNTGEKLEKIFQGISVGLSENKENLSKQVKVGITGLDNLEAFFKQNTLTNETDLKRFLELYISLYNYILDDTKRRDIFLNSISKSTKLNASLLKMAKELISEVVDAETKQKEQKEKFDIGRKFPAFPEGTKDILNKSISIADYKGKVVLLDFWATWCGPCIGELPNVINAYKEYKSKGFEIIGISLDKKDDDKFKQFIKEKNMAWRHIYDGGEWKSKLALYYGIQSIPATFILKDGIIVAKNLRGPDLDNKLKELLK